MLSLSNYNICVKIKKLELESPALVDNFFYCARICLESSVAEMTYRACCDSLVRSIHHKPSDAALALRSIFGDLILGNVCMLKPQLCDMTFGRKAKNAR